jgi:hypothetical protein
MEALRNKYLIGGILGMSQIPYPKLRESVQVGGNFVRIWMPSPHLFLLPPPPPYFALLEALKDPKNSIGGRPIGLKTEWGKCRHQKDEKRWKWRRKK